MNGTRRRHDSVQFAETAARNHPAVTLRRPERPTRPGQRLQSPQLTENTGVDAGLQLSAVTVTEFPSGSTTVPSGLRQHPFPEARGEASTRHPSGSIAP